ncbi:nucleotidyltransferase family protein [Aliikangiella sp. IMCC44359]|uniref:nucleotidyltransferase family protein n=1 Tax=Aliikangiella sp. IMCC44359 TaxID=3459125 RepID=UPI00403AA12E
MRLPVSSELQLVAILALPNLSLKQVEQSEQLIEQVDFNKLKGYVKYHRVWPCVYLNVEKYFSHKFPEFFLLYLKRQYQVCIKHSFAQFQVYAEVVKLFKENNITIRAIKGMPLARLLFGDMAKRYSKDIDVLVFERDLNCAIKLLGDLGFHCKSFEMLSISEKNIYFKKYKDVVFTNSSGVIIELHFRLCSYPSCLSKKVTRYYLSHNEEQIFVNDEEIVYLCWHGTHSLYHRLKWLVDVTLYLEKEYKDRPEKINRLIEKAKSLGEERALTISWMLAHIVYKVDCPFQIKELYRQSVITKLLVSVSLKVLHKKGYKFKIQSNLCSMILSSRTKEKLIRLLWFIKPGFGEFRTLPNMPDKLVFMYYIIRPFRLIKNHFNIMKK